MDMTLWEMREAYDKTQAIIDKLGADLRIVEARVSEQGPAATQADREQIKNLNHELRFQSQRCFQIDAEWHLRFALSFGCVCFALVGCPVGIWFSKSDYLSAFVICFLPIVTVYYPAMLCSNDLARAGTITAWFGLYAADALMVGVGAALFWRLARN
jgi:lipopolysaccharide export system permease protein